MCVCVYAEAHNLANYTSSTTFHSLYMALANILNGCGLSNKMCLEHLPKETSISHSFAVARLNDEQ